MTEEKKRVFRGAVCAGYIRQAETALFQHEIPCDNFLREAFRKDRRCGSRDRKKIRNAVFNFFRLRRCISDASSVTPELAEQLSEELCPSNLCTDLRKLIPDWCGNEFEQEITEQDFPLLLTRPPVWIRPKRGKTQILLKKLCSFGARTAEGTGEAIALDSCRTSELTALTEYQNGDFEIQDLSSQCIGLSTGAQCGELWWDACAGAGGKSLQLADRMGYTGLILSGDIRTGPVEEEKKHRILRAGARTVRCINMDASAQIPENMLFDGVLADAPCSSSGRWRRNPEAKWSLTAEKLSAYVELQAKILDNVSQAVRPGGKLVYATCSLFRQEDTLQVETFLMRHPEFEKAEWIHPLTGKPVCGSAVFHPGTGNSDGAFAAVLRRKQ